MNRVQLTDLLCNFDFKLDSHTKLWVVLDAIR